jgi:hypothetical protein
MDLQPYLDTVRHELALAAGAGGPDASELAERLTAPLESAIRLVLLDALCAAAEEVTRDLAPSSVEVRLRGRDPEFVVTTLGAQPPPVQPPSLQPAPVADDDGGTWRVTLRLPDGLRAHIEAAARRDGISINTWLVRAAAARVEPATKPTDNPRHVTGWVR